MGKTCKTIWTQAINPISAPKSEWKLELYIKPFSKYRNTIKFGVGISNLRAPTWGIPGRGPFFCKKSPRTLNKAFSEGFCILQDQFWTGIGYIDADWKVGMIQMGQSSRICKTCSQMYISIGLRYGSKPLMPVRWSIEIRVPARAERTFIFWTVFTYSWTLAHPKTIRPICVILTF